MSKRTEDELPILRGLPGRLRLTGRIGGGSQKTIYRALDADREGEIAVICLERRVGEDGDSARVQELQALARMRPHPCILPLLDVVETDDHLVLCVPYLPRGDLARRIAASERAPLPLAEALRIGTQLADAIAHVHRHDLIHGDIKPENVLLAEDGSIRLADFGLAHLGPIPANAKLSGTLAALAPERIRGEPVDARSDLYSLGCLLYELFAGRPPLSASTPAELLNLHLMARPRELQSRRRDVPIAVSQLVDRLLEKQPGARPQTALEVFGALSAALRAEAFLASDAAHSVALPIRIEAEARLDRIARAAQGGRAAIVFVAGELGSGKTEALRRLGRRAQANGFDVSIGLAQGPNAIPYAPMIDALSGLAGELVDLEPGQAARMLDFLYLSGPHRAREVQERSETRERLFASVLAALVAASQRRPILLILDDLEAADEATLALLAYLEYAISARDSIRDLDLLIVASCRDDAIPREVQDMLARGGPDSIVERVDLERLDGRDVIRLVQAHGMVSDERIVLDAIATAAGGNALSAVEITRHMQRRAREQDGTTQTGPAEWLARSSAALGVRGLVARGLEGRSPACRHALELAAVLGIDFEPALVERLGQALDLDVRAGLEEAIASGILVDRGGRLGFRHPLLREELSRGVPRDRRTWIHLKRVQFVQSDDSLSDERRDVEIAHHLIAAGDESDPQDLVEYAMRAGAHALARFAWSEAARSLDAAIARLEKEGPSPKLALAHHLSGIAFFRMLETGPCLRHFARAIALHSEQGDDTMRARVSLERARAVNWMGMMDSPEFAQSRLDLEECLERTSATHRALRAEILAVLAEQAWSRGEPARAETLCLEAQSETRPEVDHQLRAEISITLGLAQLSRLKQRDALATWRLGAQHGRRANDLSSTARCLQRARMALFLSGRIEEAAALTEEVAALNRIVQLPSEAALTHAITAAISVLAGDFERADREFARGLDQLARARYPWALLLMAPTRACARALAGDLIGAQAALDGLSDSALGNAHESLLEAFAHRHRALVEYLVGDPVRFPPTRSHELAEQIRASEPDETGLYQACIGLELACALQDAELARAALPIAEEAAERGWIVTTGWPFFLPRLIGAARLVLGDVGGAIDRLERAQDLISRRNAPIEWGRVRFDLARALVLSLDASDRARAITLAREACDALAAFPRNDLLERAQGLVRYLDASS